MFLVINFFNILLSVFCLLDCVWNVMAHAQKPDFVFRAKRTSPFKSAGGRQFSRLLAAEVCGISGSNAGYTMFRGSVKGTGYPIHSPVSPSLPLPCVTVCHHISNSYYYTFQTNHKGPSSENKHQNFLLFKPTNEQHIYINNVIYRKHSHMFRCICIIFRES